MTKAAKMNSETKPQNVDQSNSGGSKSMQSRADDSELNKTESADSESGQLDDLVSLSSQELINQLNEANAEIAEMKEEFLRSRAEVENIRRRSQNEVVAARKFAIEGFAQELLSVKDSLDQASLVELEDGASEAVQQMKEGLHLTLKQLDAAMARFSVVEIEAKPGIRFDPEQHQAISMVPSDEIQPDHIVSVLQKGFLLKERLLRPAMVMVSNGE